MLGGSVPSKLVDRLERIAEFTMDLTKTDGRIAQIGDNDSGRFLRLVATPREADGTPENHLDHRHLVGAIHGLVAREDFAAFAGPWVAEGRIVRALAGGRAARTGRPGPTVATGRKVAVRGGTLSPIGDAPDGPPTFAIDLGGGARAALRTFAYPDFGVFGYRSDRVYLVVRCGPVGQHGVGGHAHNDQLAIELSVDGEPWIQDPGTYLYTPIPELRN